MSHHITDYLFWSEITGIIIPLLSLFSNISADDMLYNETDLENSMSKIETINFHQEVEIEGIKFWCYHGKSLVTHIVFTNLKSLICLGF